MTSLIDMLDAPDAFGRSQIYAPGKLWEQLVDRVRRAAVPCNDEVVWTFLLACAYCHQDSDPRASLHQEGANAAVGPSTLANALTGEAIASNRVWLECCPYPPRLKEGNTNLDMALGDIAERSLTSEEQSNSHRQRTGENHQRPLPSSGIALSRPGGTVVFCEFKWLSDIATVVTHSARRNQLARVAENAMMLRAKHDAEATTNERVEGTLPFPAGAYVVLVTPRVFRDRPRARLYGYKWQEYDANRGSLLADIADCGLGQRQGLPPTESRISSLHFRWRSYEELMYQAPQSAFRPELLAFYQKHADRSIQG